MTNPVSLFLHQAALGDYVLVAVVVLLAFCALCACLRLARGGLPGPVDATAKLAWQMGIILGLEQAYEFTRGSFSHQPDIPIVHAYRLLDLELSHHIFVEYRVEQFALHFKLVMSAVDLFYVIAHVAVTIGALLYLYVRRREQFWFTRNLLIVTTGLALIGFYVYPTAPPRFFSNYGFVDPAVVNHLVGEGGAQLGSYTYNPYAAMPSLHVGYALVVACGLFLAERRRIVRALIALYPVAMTFVVISSGNHWLLDVLGAVLTVVVSAMIVVLLGYLRDIGTRSLHAVLGPRPMLASGGK